MNYTRAMLALCSPAKLIPQLPRRPEKSIEIPSQLQKAIKSNGREFTTGAHHGWAPVVNSSCPVASRSGHTNIRPWHFHSPNAFPLGAKQCSRFLFNGRLIGLFQDTTCAAPKGHYTLNSKGCPTSRLCGYDDFSCSQLLTASPVSGSSPLRSLPSPN